MNNLFKKLKGYQRAPRERFVALAKGIITLRELLMYELGIAITDWDRTHIETYGSFLATNLELAEYLGWKSDTSALRVKTGLLKKGFFVEVEENRIKCKGFEKWQLRKASEIKISTAKNEKLPAILEEVAAKDEDFGVQKGVYSLVSSKVDLSLSNGIPNESLSAEELEDIAANIDYQKSLLTAEKGTTYAD